ncbi:MAG: ATP-binding cassette domain-containing protein [Bacteroidota bacterium]|nr:ATP-binding cassette domain-containing protein [Bacteroidota bacterium]
MKSQAILKVENLKVQLDGQPVLQGISFEISKGECLAIIGPTGSGKSTLVRALAGNCFCRGEVVYFGKRGKKPKIAVITQQHIFRNRANTANFYYQQRFNSYDSEDSLTVEDVLLNYCKGEEDFRQALAETGILHRANTPLIQLSNGEHKRFQLAKAILQDADLMLMDNPYIGLDVSARQLLNGLIDRMVAAGRQIILVTSFSDLPDSVTQVILLERGTIQKKLGKEEFIRYCQGGRVSDHFPSGQKISLKGLDPVYHYEDFSIAVKMVDTSVGYQEKQILKDINWIVKKGECWNVSGSNGSGKSTLLSLITGDNPQAFANEIYLFDKRKGTGESIWDIKRKIGYVSPELHHYFDPKFTCFEVVASGLFDTIGLFRKLNDSQKSAILQWMGVLQLQGFEDRMFNQLSNGEQRLVLLARALVKNPPLLVLDEPCQGLDTEFSSRFISLINEICVSLKKTLIYVSHYEEEIPPCVNFTLRLEQGQIAA